jgi:hypothetical protein
MKSFRTTSEFVLLLIDSVYKPVGHELVGSSLNLEDDCAFDESVEESHGQRSLDHVVGPAIKIEQ